MKLGREELYFEFEEDVDTAVAGLLKTDLRHKFKAPYNANGPGRTALFQKLEKWLEGDEKQDVLALSVDEVEICMDIIRTKIEIANPAVSDTPNDIRLAKGLLPQMEEFTAAHSSDAE